MIALILQVSLAQGQDAGQVLFGTTRIDTQGAPSTREVVGDIYRPDGIALDRNRLDGGVL